MAGKIIGWGIRNGRPALIRSDDGQQQYERQQSADQMPPLPGPAAVERSEVALPYAGADEGPDGYPLPLTPVERQTVSGELVAGPASGGRFPETPESAMPALEPGEGEDEWASKLPPISVSKPPAPVVEGVTMRRVARGTGEYGANLDLMPQRVTRQNPMSIDEARAAGLLLPPTPGFSFRQVGRAPTGPTAGMGMTGDAERAAMDTATRGERWGQSGSTTRSQGRAASIVDQVRATRALRDQSRIRTDEALRTPQLQTGAYVGQAWIPDGKGGGRVQTSEATPGNAPKRMTPAQAATILKQAAQVRAGDKLKGIAADPATADTMENLLREQGFDVDALKGGPKAPAPAAAAPAPDKALPKIRKGRDGKTYTLAADGKYYPQE